MSIWQNTLGARRPDVPAFAIRHDFNTGQDRVHLEETGAVVHVAPDYYSAHRWCQNNWRLSSTEMLGVCEDWCVDHQRQAVALGLEVLEPVEDDRPGKPLEECTPEEMAAQVELITEIFSANGIPMPNKFRKPGR